MFGSPHFTRAPLSPSSIAAPPPTIAKSSWQPLVIGCRILEELGVEVGQGELAAEDATVLVAPFGERHGRVVHLLVEAGAEGGAPCQ